MTSAPPSTAAGSSNRFSKRPIAAFAELQRQESILGQWGLGGTSLPFVDELQERFPLVGRFLDDRGKPAISRLLPEQVAAALAGVFA